MNTTAKGDKFEDKVYKVFRGLLEDNRLPVNSQQSIIKQKQSTSLKLAIIISLPIYLLKQLWIYHHHIIRLRLLNVKTAIDRHLLMM